MPYFPTDDPWTQVMLPSQPAPSHKKAALAPPPKDPPRPTLRQSNLSFEPRRPTGGYRSRGAPHHYGFRGPRAPTSTGPNSIPIVSEAWNPNTSPPTTHRPLPSSTPNSLLSFPSPSSIYATPRPSTPPNV
jgi:hypothetical protein